MANPADNSRMAAEYDRIRWRQSVLARPGGPELLVRAIRRGAREHNLCEGFVLEVPHG